jgi:hypothetical protein
MLKPEFRELSESDIEAIVAIGREQADLMNAMEAALQAADDQRVLELARRIVGLEQQTREQ